MKKRYITSLCLLVLSLISVAAFFLLRASASDTRADSFGKDYARISVYPEDAYGFDGINKLRVSIDKRLTEDSHSASGRVWYDGFISFGKASVSGNEIKPFDAVKMTAGGDFFTLYDFEFLSGTPFYSDDNFSDRIVIDERCSFKLYGSNNAVGMPLTVNSREYYVAGVFRTEDTPAWEMQFGESPVVILPDEISDGNLYSVYEIVLPDPVDDYALTLVSDIADGAQVVDSTNRYTLKNLFANLSRLSTRSYVTRPVAFPWFENTARGNLDALSIMLATTLVLLSSLTLSIIYLIIRRKK